MIPLPLQVGAGQADQFLVGRKATVGLGPPWTTLGPRQRSVNVIRWPLAPGCADVEVEFAFAVVDSEGWINSVRYKFWRTLAAGAATGVISAITRLVAARRRAIAAAR